MTNLSEFSSSLTGLALSNNLDPPTTRYSSSTDQPSSISSRYSNTSNRQVINGQSLIAKYQPLDNYDNCQEIISKGQNNVSMIYNEKKTLINEIDRLETKDHIGILKIIINHSPRNKKLYTVNNHATFIDLNDLTRKCLWDICYYVKLCLHNQQREKEKQKAQKEFLDERRKLEDQMRRQSKLRLTRSSNVTTQKQTPNRTVVKNKDHPIKKQDDDDNDEAIMSEEELMGDEFQPIDNQVIQDGSLEPGELEETDDLDLNLMNKGLSDDDDSQNDYLSD